MPTARANSPKATTTQDEGDMGSGSAGEAAPPGPVLLASAFAAFAVGLAVPFAWQMLEGGRPSWSEVLTGLGFALTSWSLGAAIAIYIRQGVQAAADKYQLDRELGTIRDLSSSLGDQVSTQGGALATIQGLSSDLREQVGAQGDQAEQVAAAMKHGLGRLEGLNTRIGESLDAQGERAQRTATELTQGLQGLEQLSTKIRETLAAHGEELQRQSSLLEGLSQEDRSIALAEITAVAQAGAAEDTDPCSQGEAEAKAEFSEELPEVPSKTVSAMGVSQEDAEKVAPFEGHQIPLRPLAALFEFLEGVDYQVPGGKGRLTPGDLWGYRVRGKGPRFWFISTPDAVGRSGRVSADYVQTRTLWKVSYTGAVEAVHPHPAPESYDD